MALTPLSYSQGGNKLSDIKDYINNQVVPDSTNPSVTSLTATSVTVSGSILVTGSIDADFLTANPVSGSLPTAAPTGSIFVSGSAGTYKLFFWNGTAFFTASMSQI